MKGTAHLLYGFVGVGKTTFARRLERELPAVRYSHDEWMHALYGPTPSADDFARLPQLQDLLRQHAVRILELGCDVVLDEGYWSRESRDKIRGLLEDAGVRYVLYRITCPEAEIKRRVSARTRDLPADSLWIGDADIQLFKPRFEPLGPDEEHVDIDGTQNKLLETTGGVSKSPANRKRHVRPARVSACR